MPSIAQKEVQNTTKDMNREEEEKSKSIISWHLPRRRTDGIPRIRLTHRPLPQRKHNLLLHLVDVLLQIRVLLAMLLDAAPVDEEP